MHHGSNHSLIHPNVFEMLRSPYFMPHSGFGRLGGTCGTHALAVMLRQDPRIIERSKPKRAFYWQPRTLIRFLQAKGCIVKQVTKASAAYSPVGFKNNLQEDHVLLFDQWFANYAGKNRDLHSYQVLYRSKLYHSGEEHELKPLEFLNNPILNCWVVYHHSWRIPTEASLLRNQMLDHKRNLLLRATQFAEQEARLAVEAATVSREASGNHDQEREGEGAKALWRCPRRGGGFRPLISPPRGAPIGPR